jgi:hypothetical protein
MKFPSTHPTVEGRLVGGCLTGFVHGMNSRDDPRPEKAAQKELSIPETRTVAAQAPPLLRET